MHRRQACEGPIRIGRGVEEGGGERRAWDMFCGLTCIAWLGSVDLWLDSARLELGSLATLR